MQYAGDVNATVDIDDDLLLVVREIAQQRNSTVGREISRLLREVLQPKSFAVEYRDGIPVLPHRPHGPVVTVELVNRLLEEDE